MSAESKNFCSKLSVVVIGRNEGARLERCLESVHSMRRDWEVEVIYVDSGSSDDSVALAERLGAKTIALTPQRPTAALGRNAGWRAATGEMILFLDGDTVLEKNFAATAMREFEDGAVACVCGDRREMFSRATVYNRVLDLDWMHAPGPAAFCGGDALFRKSVLEQVGGFDESLIAGEEPEMCRRMIAMGKRIVHLDVAMTQHDLAIKSFDQYWRRAMRTGHAYAEVSARFARSRDRFWSAEAERNRLQVLAMGVVVMAGVATSVWMWSAWPVVVVMAMLCMLALRTAWKARWRSTSAWTLLLYGVHSHLQQVPICVGQVRYAWNRRRGQRMGIVEYKQS
jgi:cellulose synthase/poly-beta-1,6-N-acetylglucosamine synthase-like glycosyltransferase